jgi:iron complex outermembrane receptor protein
MTTFTVKLISTKKNNKNDEKDKEKQKKYYIITKQKEIVVTATLVPKPLKKSFSAVDVVRKLDIESVSASNSLDILRYYPGIHVNRTGNFGRADVEIRGLGQNCRRVAVLVDGKPEKMGLFGCAVSHAFPLDNVERIEIVKGPSSVLYGGEALGGAINIITHLPKKQFETELNMSYGSYKTHQISLKHGGNRNTFRYFLTYDNRASNGHLANANYSGQSITGNMEYAISPKTGIRFQGKYFQGKKHEPGTIDHPLTDFWNDYRRGSLAISLNTKRRKSEFNLKLYRNFGNHEFSDGWDSKDFTNGLQVWYTTRGIKRNQIILGGDYRFFGGETFSWPVGSWNKNEASLFFQNETLLSSKWILSTGMRLQIDSLYGQELCPQLGILFQASNKTSFRGLISKGFRSPQINELYMYPPANPDLKPERVWNYEIGLEQNIGRKINLKANIFHMNGSNMIQTVINQLPPPAYIFANTGEFTFTGCEICFEVNFLDGIYGTGSYTIMDLGDFTKGKPGEKLDLFLRLSKQKFFISIQGQYVSNYFKDDFSKNPIPSYFLLNSRFSIKLAKDLNLTLDVNNILEKKYYIFGEFPGLTAGLYEMPGRHFQLGFQFSPESKK